MSIVSFAATPNASKKSPVLIQVEENELKRLIAAMRSAEDVLQRSGFYGAAVVYAELATTSVGLFNVRIEVRRVYWNIPAFTDPDYVSYVITYESGQLLFSTEINDTTYTTDWIPTRVFEEHRHAA